ncbi:MAG: glycosyltransferase family 39 protein [bacterium]|nr:glycosyltransferase family 39 protein [bacterium]
MTSRSHWKPVALVILLGVVARIATVILFGGFDHPVLWEYHELALNLLRHHEYRVEQLGTTYWIMGPPLYSFLSAGVYGLTGESVRALLAVQLILSSLTPGLVYYLGLWLGGRRLGLMSGAFTALHPGLVYYVNNLHSLNIDVPLLWGSLLACYLWVRRQSLRWAVITGLLVGLTLLARSTILVFLATAPLWAWLGRLPLKRFLAQWLLIMFISGLVVLPWVVRNRAVSGRWIFIQKTGEVFWRGNNPNATGTSFTVSGTRMIDALPPQTRAHLLTLTEMEQEDWFREQARTFVWAHPWRFLQITGRKLFYFVWFAPQWGMRYSPTATALYKGTYPLLLLGALGGFLWVGRFGSPEQRLLTVIVLLFYGSLAVAHAFFYVEGRHRWPVEPLMLTYAWLALTKGWLWFGRHNRMLGKPHLGAKEG